jgi:hypothetical protein
MNCLSLRDLDQPIFDIARSRAERVDQIGAALQPLEKTTTVQELSSDIRTGYIA